MKLPTGGWPLVIVLCVAAAVLVLTYALLGRTTYVPTPPRPAPTHLGGAAAPAPEA